jgi:site-specific DNA-adenine methylase
LGLLWRFYNAGEAMANEEQKMSGFKMANSPIRYLGNIHQQVAAKVFACLPADKKFQCFYDLFAGSASMTLIAIKNNLAERYVVNDAYQPLQALWRAIATDPQTLLSNYQDYQQKLLRADSPQQQNFIYQTLQTEFNAEQEPALLAFLLNYSAYGAVRLTAGKLNNEFQLNDDVFSLNLAEAHTLFAKVDITFCSKNFTEFNQFDRGDFLFFDPPFPDTPDAIESPAQHIYHRPESRQELARKLDDMLAYLNQLASTYVCIYGLQEQEAIFMLKNAARHSYHAVELPDNPLHNPKVNFYLSASLAGL